MLLIGVKEENGRLISRWNLTYNASWRQILKAVASVFDYHDKLEILIDDMKAVVPSKKKVMKLKEGGTLTVRGFSRILKVPMTITFYNQ